jgi:hypothetical protein
MAAGFTAAKIEPNGQPQWRTALIDPQTGASHGFACLEVLTAFLETKMVEVGERV